MTNDGSLRDKKFKLNKSLGNTVGVLSMSKQEIELNKSQNNPRKILRII